MFAVCPWHWHVIISFQCMFVCMFALVSSSVNMQLIAFSLPLSPLAETEKRSTFAILLLNPVLHHFFRSRRVNHSYLYWNIHTKHIPPNCAKMRQFRIKSKSENSEPSKKRSGPGRSNIQVNVNFAFIHLKKCKA